MKPSKNILHTKHQKELTSLIQLFHYNLQVCINIQFKINYPKTKYISVVLVGYEISNQVRDKKLLSSLKQELKHYCLQQLSNLLIIFIKDEEMVYKIYFTFSFS